MNLKIELIWLADKLDRVGMNKEAGIIDLVIKKASIEGWLESLEGAEEFAGAKGTIVSPGALRETLEELNRVTRDRDEQPDSQFGLESLLRSEDSSSEA